MKRNFSCNDSLTHFPSHPLEGEMKAEEECIYDEEGGQIGDKKRRLSNHQVKSLEKIFEIDNKLDPERKVKVAEDLGLQPRQVAIWFQNRRARWKTKQLERDYTLLKSDYDALNLNYHKLKEEKETIVKQLVELKAKLPNDTTKRNDEFDINEKPFFLESNPTNTNDEVYTHLNYENHQKILDLKDRFSDSDSSGVLNEENITASNLIGSPLLNMASFGISSLCSSSTTPLNSTEISDLRTYQSDPYLVSHAEEESCNIFLVDQAPNLCWYFQDHRTTA